MQGGQQNPTFLSFHITIISGDTSPPIIGQVVLIVAESGVDGNAAGWSLHPEINAMSDVMIDSE